MAMTFATDVTLESAKVLKVNTINIPTSSGGSSYSAGTSGQVLKTNGTTVYWGDESGGNVKQTNTTTNANYSILLSYSENTTTEKTEQARKNSNVYVNASTGQIYSMNKPVLVGEYSSSTAPSSPVTGEIWLKETTMSLEEAKPLVIQFTASTLPTTITNSAITADMEVIKSDIGNPYVQETNLTVTTSAGSLTVSGSLSASTPITLWLARCR